MQIRKKNIIHKILDDYFTNKLIYKIKEYLDLFRIEITTSECETKKNRYLYIYINRVGRGKLEEARCIGRINKSESIFLYNNKNFLKCMKKNVEIELEMISKGL